MLQPEVRCVEFVDTVTEWMEGGLTTDERLLIEEHLSICPHCTRFVDQIRASVVALRRAASEPEAAPTYLQNALLDAFRNRNA